MSMLSRPLSRRQMNDRSLLFFAPELFGGSASEAGPTLNAKREPAVWSTDPMSRKVYSGPLGKKLMTQTVTWVDRTRRALVVSVVVFEEDGSELMEFQSSLAGADPILAHSLHRLVAALTFVNQEQLDLAAAAVFHKTPYAMDGLIYPPAEAELALRKQLGEGYDAAVQHLSDDVARDIRLLRECGLEVPTTMVTQACVDGRLPYSEKLARLDVVSPEQIRARDAARAAVLDPLRPFLDRLVGNRPASDTARATVEAGILDLASRGITDGDLLLGYGVVMYLHNRTRRIMALANGFALVFGFPLEQPDCIGTAARHVRSVMTDSPRDEQWLRWGLAGICNDVAVGHLRVKRNDL